MRSLPQYFEDRVLLLLADDGGHHVAAYASLDSKTRRADGELGAQKMISTLPCVCFVNSATDANAAQLSLMDNRHTVTESFSVGKDVGREKDGLAFAAQLLDKFADLAPPHRVEAGHRLIQEHDFGVMEDGLRKPYTLQHAFGELAQLQSGRLSMPTRSIIAATRPERSFAGTPESCA